ncbi:MAG: 16S rRNA (adenine(1518)-N(6)/adenine(1519)-N(6))-dimethyltransferase RsmA [Terriglobia bacterium]
MGDLCGSTLLDARHLVKRNSLFNAAAEDHGQKFAGRLGRTDYNVCVKRRAYGRPFGRRPKLGQHFLVHRGMRERIVELLGCGAGDCWLEIGAGHGEMTALLARRAARVLAVEADAWLVSELRGRFREVPAVEVIHADILQVSFAELAGASGAGSLRVYGNLPYYITSPILSHLFGSLTLIEDIFVVVQREVGERLATAPGRREYGYLSALTQFYTLPKLLLRIPPGAFRPPPRVQSALVRLKPPGVGSEVAPAEAEAFIRFLGLCFRQKRKTLVNNLRRVYPLAQVQAALSASGHTLRTRAEALSVRELLELYRRLAR